MAPRAKGKAKPRLTGIRRSQGVREFERRMAAIADRGPLAGAEGSPYSRF